MVKGEGVSPNERGRILYEASHNAARMIVERINLESLGLNHLKLPLCTEEEAAKIEDLLPKAKVGFALSLKPERVLRSETRELLIQTTPMTLDAFEAPITIREDQNNLPEFGHTLATIAHLLKMRTVTYFNFVEPPKDVDYNLGLKETYWNINLFSVDHLWTMMDDLENLTRAALYQDGNMDIADLLKVGHFFAAGEEIAKIFSEENI